jgi:hypothetical protein
MDACDPQRNMIRNGTPSAQFDLHAPDVSSVLGGRGSTADVDDCGGADRWRAVQP